MVPRTVKEQAGRKKHQMLQTLLPYSVVQDEYYSEKDGVGAAVEIHLRQPYPAADNGAASWRLALRRLQRSSTQIAHSAYE